MKKDDVIYAGVMAALFCICIMACGLSACGDVSKGDVVKVEETIKEIEIEEVYSSFSTNVHRLVDNKTHMVCYIYNGYEKGGISCERIGE